MANTAASPSNDHGSDRPVSVLRRDEVDIAVDRLVDVLIAIEHLEVGERLELGVLAHGYPFWLSLQIAY
jgi:hypothetical protein